MLNDQTAETEESLKIRLLEVEILGLRLTIDSLTAQVQGLREVALGREITGAFEGDEIKID